MLLSKLEFGSYLTYTPRGTDEKAKQSINIRNYIKSEASIGNPQKFMSQYVVERIKTHLNELPFKDFFSLNTYLVPVPKSSLIQPNTLWVSSKIAKAMSTTGFGIYCECLKRITSVQKAAYAQQGKRPSAIEHYNSLECQLPLHKPTEIILIDDSFSL